MGSRDCIIAGNWKMYKTATEAVDYIEAFKNMVSDSEPSVYLAVPYTAIYSAAEHSQGTNIVVGAQNMNDATEGAFTGDISAVMIKDAGAKFVIIGHSERRHVFGETDEFINRKVKKAIAEQIQPILCIGETQEQRESGQTEEILKIQITKGLEEITPEQMKNVVVAYEPVWAIGTGLTATPETAQQAHYYTRQQIAEIFNENVAEKVSILYGGSVKPDNAKTLIDQPDVDGALVGGASLSPDVFEKIVNYQRVPVTEKE